MLGVLVDRRDASSDTSVRCGTSCLGDTFLQEVILQKVGNNNLILATSQILGVRSWFY